MANKINFVTGETYTLAELFSEDRRIIIPDLQRDYCWGNEDNTKGTDETGELVSDFVNGLLEQFKDQKDRKDKGVLNLGLFYGYEVPANHIQLCDGQQRLTTLFLLLGMINKNVGKFRQHLISDFEYEKDDKEPYLNYAIRESSLYFISDLVCHFFIDNKDGVSSIKSANWYYDDYNLDPSIQSMLNALARIEVLLSDKQSDLLEFGEWLLHKVTFLYFDMETRKNGEETFVVINTTGESLSSTQNLKPLVIHEKNDSFDNTIYAAEDEYGTIMKIDQCWEQIETWFWKERKGENETADAGFAEFLRWISIIEQVDKPVIQHVLQGRKCDFPYKEIPFFIIYNYWKALRWIKEKSDFQFAEDYLSPALNKDVNGRNAIGQKECFVLLPVLKYVYMNLSDIGSDTGKQRNAKRLYEFFKNIIRLDNVQKAVNTLVADALHAVDIVMKSHDWHQGDIINLLNFEGESSKLSSQVLTEEERMKLRILRNSLRRTSVEEALWNAQSHPIWDGEILPMIEWATQNGVFDYDRFRGYAGKFAEVFSGNCDSNIDDVRRALLVRGLHSYPHIFKGYTNYSFGWDWSDWHTLIFSNKDKFKLFFDELLNGKTLQNISVVSSAGVFQRFVKHPELLNYCEQKNIQKWDNSYCLVRQHKATKYIELETFCLYLDYKNITTYDEIVAFNPDTGVDYRGWKMWLWECGPSALVFEKDWRNGMRIAIDIHYNRTKLDDWDTQLFLKPQDKNTERIAEIELRQIAAACNLCWNGERYELKDLSRQGVVDEINKLISTISICHISSQ